MSLTKNSGTDSEAAVSSDGEKYATALLLDDVLAVRVLVAAYGISATTRLLDVEATSPTVSLLDAEGRQREHSRHELTRIRGRLAFLAEGFGGRLEAAAHRLLVPLQRALARDEAKARGETPAPWVPEFFDDREAMIDLREVLSRVFEEYDCLRAAAAFTEIDKALFPPEPVPAQAPEPRAACPDPSKLN
jgi:hypothetical protein